MTDNPGNFTIDFVRSREIPMSLHPIPGGSIYVCVDCKQIGREHKVIEVPGSQSDKRSCWGPGIPTTLHQCTGCERTTGPWVSADIVGGGY